MATTSERPALRVCPPCWDARNSPVDQHRCWARIVELCDTTSCDCPCREDRHSDLWTIDLDHDMAVRPLSDPFNPNG
jgi:hypothetical protein